MIRLHSENFRCQLKVHLFQLIITIYINENLTQKAVHYNFKNGIV